MKGRLLSAFAGMAAMMSSATGWAQDKLPDPAADWDHLWFEILVDLFVIGGIFAVAAAIMLIKYKAKSPDAVGNGPRLTKVQALAWAFIPATIFMADDFFLAAKGWTLWNTYRTVPENAMEIKVTGSMWNWEFEYPDGTTSTYYPDEATEADKGDGLVVPVGRAVVLRMTSTDVIHSFGMANYRVKEDLMPGRITYIWFNPKEVKNSFVTCTEFCGTNHSRMYAPVKAIAPAKFKEWLKKQADA
ncbi:MAG: hypothetical protein HQL53_08260 [Magnetococcales bacterium]|nr:hypothetical protein [Magnetococcales bacterium]